MYIDVWRIQQLTSLGDPLNENPRYRKVGYPGIDLTEIAYISVYLRLKEL